MRVRAITLGLILLAACGSGTKAQTNDDAPSAVVVTTTTTADATGRDVAQITEFDRATRTISYDVVQLLTGDEARTAYEADKGESLETDYYIRNQNSRLRTATISDDAVFRVNTLGGNGSTDKEVDYETFAAYFNGEQALRTYFVIARRDAKVVAINEMYLS